jgi:hypothetical protein
MATFCKNQVVTYSNRGGEWRIIEDGERDKVFLDCQRYTIENTLTGERLKGCRDKDLFGKSSEYYNAFKSQVETQ